MLDVVLGLPELERQCRILSAMCSRVPRPLIGLDFTQYFSEDFSISLQYNYSVAADTSVFILGDVGDNTITVLRAKISYFLHRDDRRVPGLPNRW